MQPLREVYSLLMPLDDGRVMLPRAAIAEVTGFVRPKDRPEDAPDFVLGFIDWQGQKIPLVSFEAARGHGVPELGRRTRIAIVFGIANRLDPNVFAVVTQGYPYLVRVNENVLKPEEMDADEKLVLARVRMANEKPYIPDLGQLEILIAEGLGIAPPEDGKDGPGESVDELDSFDTGEEDELDAGFLEDESAESEEPGDDAESGEAQDVDLGSVTAFGAETDYSAELKDLSDAVDDKDGGEDTDGNAEEDDFSVDVSGLEVDDGEDAPADDASEKNDDEIDFSDIEIDFDEEDEKKDS